MRVSADDLRAFVLDALHYDDVSSGSCARSGPVT